MKANSVTFQVMRGEYSRNYQNVNTYYALLTNLSQMILLGGVLGFFFVGFFCLVFFFSFVFCIIMGVQKDYVKFKIRCMWLDKLMIRKR